VALVLFLPSVWTRDLWNPDEPRYAEATRQMVARGDLLVPHFNGEVYSEKPPLFFWLSLVAGRLPGIPPAAGGRLVGILASIATLILTWRIGTLIMGEATGALAALLLSASIIFWHLAQSGVIDPLLTLCCTAALYGFARHLRGRGGGLLLFYAGCSLGVIAKGPVAFLVPALAVLTFRLLSDGPRGLRASHPLWGIPLVCAPALIWLALAAGRAGPGYLETMLVTQNLGRTTDAYGHVQPFYYYLLVLPPILMPLTCFLPQSLMAAWREKILGIRPMLLPLAWFASTFVFFSVVSSKKTRYMLVLAPAAALLVAGWMMRHLRDPDGRLRSGRVPLALTAAGGLGMALLLAIPGLAGTGVIPERVMDPLREPHSLEALTALERILSWPGSLALLIPAGALAAGCGLALRLALLRRAAALPAFLGGWIVLLAMAGTVWTPILDPVKSARGFATMVRSGPPGGALYLLDDHHPPGLNFYLPADRIPVLRNRKGRIRASREPGARFIGLLPIMERVQRRSGIRFGDRLCRRIGSEILCLASATPPASPPREAPPGKVQKLDSR
jgi:hypothetical protein